MQDLKMRDMNLRHQFARVEIVDMKMRDQFAGVENAGKVSMESQSVKKCLQVIVFLCRVIQCFDAVGWAAGRASGL